MIAVESPGFLARTELSGQARIFLPAVTSIPPMSQTASPVLDRLRRALEGKRPPVAELIGFQLIAVDRGYAKVELEAGPQHANPMGTLHGGILCDIADAAMGIAYASNLAEGETFTTLELKINFLKPVWNARLTAEGRVVKAGRTIGLTECDIFDSEGKLVARASSTCMTLRGADAQGR
jgi:uncharacterized protein (TIGR00369 family)